MTRYTKGHATGNDFVILHPEVGWEPPTEAQIAAICERRFGIGADGLIWPAKVADIPGAEGEPDDWFMEYRNADGNGMRLFAYWLHERGDIGAEASIGTRAGTRRVTVSEGGCVSVSMGQAKLLDEACTVRADGFSLGATAVTVGNPHLVCEVASGQLRELNLTEQPTFDAPFKAGANIEFVASKSSNHIALRVHERGVGETLSCGTGAVAAAFWQSRRTGSKEVRVDVPGGRLEVRFDHEATLIGHATIVAEGELDEKWLDSLSDK